MLPRALEPPMENWEFHLPGLYEDWCPICQTMTCTDSELIETRPSTDPEIEYEEVWHLICTTCGQRYRFEIEHYPCRVPETDLEAPSGVATEGAAARLILFAAVGWILWWWLVF